MRDSPVRLNSTVLKVAWLAASFRRRIILRLLHRLVRRRRLSKETVSPRIARQNRDRPAVLGFRWLLLFERRAGQETAVRAQADWRVRMIRGRESTRRV